MTTPTSVPTVDQPELPHVGPRARAAKPPGACAALASGWSWRPASPCCCGS